MKIDVTKTIQLNPNNEDSTATIKEIATQALFTASSQTISREKSKELYDKIGDAKKEVSLEAGEMESLKKCVDSGFVRGVAWQFANIVDPQD